MGQRVYLVDEGALWDERINLLLRGSDSLYAGGMCKICLTLINLYG